MEEYLIQKSTLDGIADAINAKTGESAPLSPLNMASKIGGIAPDLEEKTVTVTENGTTTITPSAGKDGISEVELTVNVQGGGGSDKAPELWSGVNFMDYDGTIVESWTPEEALQKTALPAALEQEWGNSIGWQWTLARIQEIMAAEPTQQINVAHLYSTKSAGTEIILNIPYDNFTGTLSVGIDGSVSIDFGDETAAVSATGTNRNTMQNFVHTYAHKGTYTITIIAGTTETRYLFRGMAYSTSAYCSEIWWNQAAGNTNNIRSNYPWNACVKELRINGKVNLDYQSLSGLSHLEKVNWNSEYSAELYANAFYNCGLMAFMSKSGVNYLRYGNSSISNPSLKRVSFNYGSAANGLQFQNMCGLTRIPYCPGPSLIIQDCITISELDVAAKVTTLGSFSGCASLKKFRFYRESPPTAQSSSVFPVTSGVNLFIPYDSPLYINATNYPTTVNNNRYIGFGKFAVGAALPTRTTDTTQNLTWYATEADAVAETNPITTGNGNEVYCRYVAA